MNEDEVHRLIMDACDKANSIEMLGADGNELSVHTKLEVLIGTHAWLVKKWILGESKPYAPSIKKLQLFVYED